MTLPLHLKCQQTVIFLSELAEFIEESSRFTDSVKKKFKKGLNVKFVATNYSRTPKSLQLSWKTKFFEKSQENFGAKNKVKKRLSTKEAFRCLQAALKCTEEQEEIDSVKFLLLKRMRDLAARKSSQKAKENFFS